MSGSWSRLLSQPGNPHPLQSRSPVLSSAAPPPRHGWRWQEGSPQPHATGLPCRWLCQVSTHRQRWRGGGVSPGGPLPPPCRSPRQRWTRTQGRPSRPRRAAVCHKPNQISRSGEQFASPWESVRCLCLAVHVASRLRHGALRGVGQSNGAAGIAGQGRAAHFALSCLGHPCVPWERALWGFPAPLIPAPFAPVHLISLHLSPLFYTFLFPPFFWSHPISFVLSHLISLLSHPLCFIPSLLIPSHPTPSDLSHLLLSILTHPAHPTIPASSHPVPVLLSHSTFCCCTPSSPGHLITPFHLFHPVPSYSVLTPTTSTSLSAAPAHHGNVCSLWIPHLLLRFQPFPIQRQILLGNSIRIQPGAKGKHQAGADLLQMKRCRSDSEAGSLAWLHLALGKAGKGVQLCSHRIGVQLLL